jgi:hypothetical protein
MKTNYFTANLPDPEGPPEATDTYCEQCGCTIYGQPYEDDKRRLLCLDCQPSKADE